MPANNSKIMGEVLLKQIKAKYLISYDAESNVINVSLSTCKRVTKHDVGAFIINSKKPKRKFCFSESVVKMWVELQQDDKTKDITLFDVQNATTALRVMYQKVTKQNVVKLIKEKFDGITKI